MSNLPKNVPHLTEEKIRENREKYLKRHLCESCQLEFPTCPSRKIEFGTGVGNDNVIECDAFQANQGNKVRGKMRIFEKLDKMNLQDETNGTRTVAVSNALVKMEKVKAGSHITIGCDYQSMLDLLDNKARVFLCIVNYDEYKKLDDK